MNGDRAFGRRVRAARELAGLRSTRALADKINERGLSYSTLRAIEEGKRITEPSELTAIARACGLPEAWFRMDWSRALDALEHAGGESPAQISQRRIENAESQLASLWEAITQLRADTGSLREQVEDLTRREMRRREREAAEQEMPRPESHRGTSDAPGG